MLRWLHLFGLESSSIRLETPKRYYEETVTSASGTVVSMSNT